MDTLKYVNLFMMTGLSTTVNYLANVQLTCIFTLQTPTHVRKRSR
ncbi:hypothetical protein SAMN05660236_1979 [Ohtaekwangia koreensis]|uniref:Uncharacterized protein n=1 Tax=Ohtaekwangia koreensis TaxID=688867 RepID=A0A1T5KAC8_9BACT|nr:hypothetical protein SAMN05660236_1979 [Ohtaekwangia koreensis]